jgi:hypothetical protein
LRGAGWLADGGFAMTKGHETLMLTDSAQNTGKSLSRQPQQKQALRALRHCVKIRCILFDPKGFPYEQTLRHP